MRLLTAALEALYAAFPLVHGMRGKPGGRGKNEICIRRIRDTLLRAGVDNHGSIFMVDHKLRLVNTSTKASSNRSSPERRLVAR